MSTINATAAAVDRQLAQEGVAFSGPIAAAAQKYGLDPDLLAAVAAQETGGPGSNAGANIVGDGGHGHGLFQIDDRWHQFAATAAAMNPLKNAEYAAGMLSGLLKQYGGNVRQALSTYNAGSPNATGTLTRWGDGRQLSYADSVLRHYQGLRGAHRHTPNAVATANSDQHQLAGNIFSEIAQTNQLQQFAQSSAPGIQPSAARAAQKNDISWAGIIDTVDDSI